MLTESVTWLFSQTRIVKRLISLVLDTLFISIAFYFILRKLTHLFFFDNRVSRRMVRREEILLVAHDTWYDIVVQLPVRLLR